MGGYGTGRAALIALATDFGVGGLYTGQMRVVLTHAAPGSPIVDLLPDLPAFDPYRSAYILERYANCRAGLRPGDVVLGIVDPGVGSDRSGVILRAGGIWYVGPDNGLFSMLTRADRSGCRAWSLPAADGTASATFHGRDVFASVAAALVRGALPESLGAEIPAAAVDRPDWPDGLAEVLMIDGYGNAITGVAASAVADAERLLVKGRCLERRRTFSDVTPGNAFFYENANGLIEIAVNRGRADLSLGLACGTPVAIVPGNDDAEEIAPEPIPSAPGPQFSKRSSKKP